MPFHKRLYHIVAQCVLDNPVAVLQGMNHALFRVVYFKLPIPARSVFPIQQFPLQFIQLLPQIHFKRYHVLLASLSPPRLQMRPVQIFKPAHFLISHFYAFSSHPFQNRRAALPP